MAQYAVEIPVSELRIGDEIVTSKTENSGRVLKSFVVKTIGPCHGDSYARYVHINTSKCYTVAGLVEVASGHDR